ncbi:phytanoyl-dioxygenase [Seiridium cupressi]
MPSTGRQLPRRGLKPASSDPQLTVVELSAEELKSKKIGSHNLQAAVEALHRDGIVALKNAVEVEHLDKLNARMVPEAEELYARPTTHRNFGNSTGNIQQEPVLEDGFIFEDVLANPWATDVIQCMLGPRPTLRFYSANTAFKASGRQPPHIDVHFDFPKIPFGYCVNINLVDTSPENGSTEVWLGSHVDASVEDLNRYDIIDDGVLSERRKISPPVQPTLPKGSLIIRDFRLWHAGMPNKTDEPRLPANVKDKIEWGDLVPCVDWMPEGICPCLNQVLWHWLQALRCGREDSRECHLFETSQPAILSPRPAEADNFSSFFLPRSKSFFALFAFRVQHPKATTKNTIRTSEKGEIWWKVEDDAELQQLALRPQHQAFEGLPQGQIFVSSCVLKAMKHGESDKRKKGQHTIVDAANIHARRRPEGIRTALDREGVFAPVAETEIVVETEVACAAAYASTGASFKLARLPTRA